MRLVVFSMLASFGDFLEDKLEQPFEVCTSLRPPGSDPEKLYLLHITGMKPACYDWLSRYVSDGPVIAAVCSDLPAIEEMLECVRLGASAYCNSHMAANHYRQMLRLVAAGESWFPPPLLQQTFKLAQQAIEPLVRPELMQSLTPREQEIAMAVCAGHSNRRVADLLSISEATVKTHLSSIFRKLDVEDRVGLVLLLKSG